MKIKTLFLIGFLFLFITLFFISYFYGWNYQTYLPKKVYENETIIKLHIDKADESEYFHRRYSHEPYPLNTFDLYLYEGKGYLIEDITASSGCFSGEKFLERCDYFITLDKRRSD